MATYYLKGIASDLTGGADFSKEISTVVETAGSIAVSVANGATETSYAFTKAHKPSNAAWGTWATTVKVNVTTAVANMFLAIQIDRVNSAGTVQESSTATAEQQLSATGVYTFNVASKAWSAGACGDRIRVRYIFRSANGHGTALSVTIATGVANNEVTPASLTEHTGTCYGTFALIPQQFDATHLAKIATGATTSDGVTTNLYLDALVGSWDKADQLTMKVENEAVGTAFDNVANQTQAIALQVDPDSPYVRRSHATVYDPTRKRMLLFGGYNGTTNFNDVWELTLDPLASPQPQWRQLAPTGTPPSARRTHVAIFDATLNRMIVGFGYTTGDNNDLYSLSFSGSRDGAWTTLSPTGTVPAARSQPSIANDPTHNKAYLVGGWGAARYNDIQELDYSTTNCAWTAKSADGAAGAMSKRNDPAVIWDDIASRLIIFGGSDGTNYLNDTWQYVPSTNTWTDKTAVFSGTAPSTRELMFKGHDTVNNRLVIFGGRAGTTAALVRDDYAYLTLAAGSETWNVTTPTAGEKSYGAWTNAGCYDPENQLMLCFGGFDSSLESQRNVLAIDCSATALTMADVTPNHYLRGRDAMAYATNPDLNESLAAGGYARVITDLINGNHTNEMWIYNHTSGYWRPALRGKAAIGWTNREGAVAIYDTNRNRFIIWGGLAGNNTSNNTYFNDTWELKADANNEYQLTKLAPTGTKPSARWLAAAVYDAVNDRMVVFGGDDGTNYLNDVYTLSFSGGADGAWASLTPSGTAHTAVRQAGYAYDSTNNRMYIFGGGTGVSSFTNTNHYISLGSGTEAWSSALATSPTARRGMTCRYDAAKGKIICFGGFNGTVVYNDLYTYSVSGNSWSTLTPSVNPEARRSHFVGIDETNDKYVIFGGRDAADAALSFNSRANTYELDYSNATEANWNWTKKDPVIYINGSIPVTGLTASTSYHWQAWVTGSSGLDSAKLSYGGNAESAADFVTAGAGATAVTITKSLAYAVKVTPSTLTKSLQYTVKATPTALTKSLQYAVRTSATALTKSLQYVVKAAVSITKSLQYTIKATPTAITKSLAYSVTVASSLTKSLSYAITASQSLTKSLSYEVRTAQSLTKNLTYTVLTTVATITKSLQYVIVATTSVTITKSLTYRVTATPTAITKALQYTVLAATSLTKSLKYTIVTTPTAVTKSLAYSISLPPTTLTKSLQYEVKTTASVTKTLQYEVVTSSALTKSLAYIVVNQTTITKSLKYTIIGTPATLTKSLAYHVTKTPTAITKALVYRVTTTATALTKALTYDVKTAQAVTKSLQYIVVAPVSITKSLKYTIIATPSAVTKSLQYAVNVTPTALSKSLKYTVIIIASITKSLAYEVKSAQSLTKSLKYTIVGTPTALTKSLQYSIGIPPVTINKSLKYTIITSATIQKTLNYEVVKAQSITKSLQYIVVSAQSITKALKYTIITHPAALTKSLVYEVATTSAITKSLVYRVVTTSALTKSLQYEVRSAQTVTKSLQYTIASAQSVTKSLKYTIIRTATALTKSLQYNLIAAPITIQRALKYTVITVASLTKSLQYEVRIAVGITKSLKYTIVGAQSLTKTLTYAVITTPASLTKSLAYEVVTATSLTKSLQYVVTTAQSITKSLRYVIVSAQALTKSLKYTIVGTPASITKALQYSVVTTKSLTKSLRYTVVVTATTVTKSLAYEVIAAHSLTKSLKYTVVRQQAVTKSLQYEIKTSASLTKSLQYVVVATQSLTKSLQYIVSAPAVITKTLRYAITITANSITKSLRYAVGTTPASITKSLSYAILTTKSITKSLQYTLGTVTLNITKSLAYYVYVPIAVNKSLKYEIVVAPTVTKSLKYTIVTTPAVLTKSLQYYVLANPYAVVVSGYTPDPKYGRTVGQYGQTVSSYSRDIAQGYRKL